MVLATAFLALGYAYWLARQTFAADKGTDEMQRIWSYIRDGANAYLRTQLRTIADHHRRPDRADVPERGAGASPPVKRTSCSAAAAVESAYAQNIAANTGLTEAEVLPLLETQTAKKCRYRERVHGFPARTPGGHG